MTSVVTPRSEVAEDIVRILAPYAEAGGSIDGLYVTSALARASRLDDYMRIKGDYQEDAFDPTDVEAGLELAISVIDGLASQQAMPDDWWVGARNALARRVGLPEVAG